MQHQSGLVNVDLRLVLFVLLLYAIFKIRIPKHIHASILHAETHCEVLEGAK